MSDVEAGPASAPDPPPPLEAENSLEDVDGDASLLDSPGPGDPDDSLALEDPPLVDAPEPGGTDDPKALVTEESAADGHEEKDTPAGDEEKPDVDVTADVQKETPEQVEGPVEEFPADNTPDVIVTLVILPENFQHVLNVKAMTTGAELKEAVVAELPLPYDALSLRYGEEDFPDDVALLDVGIKPGAAAELELVVRFAPEPENASRVASRFSSSESASASASCAAPGRSAGMKRETPRAPPRGARRAPVCSRSESRSSSDDESRVASASGPTVVGRISNAPSSSLSSSSKPAEGSASPASSSPASPRDASPTAADAARRARRAAGPAPAGERPEPRASSSDTTTNGRFDARCFTAR